MNPRASHPSSWRQEKGANRETEKVSRGRLKEGVVWLLEAGRWRCFGGTRSQSMPGAALGQGGKMVKEGERGDLALGPRAGAVWVA